MNSSREMRTVRIGLLVAVGLLVLALGIVGITSRHQIFEKKVSYFSYFPDAAGLKEGSGVWYQGVEVGFISKIEFSKDVDVQNVKIYYKISADLVPRIRTGTRASIRTLGLLGDKYLALITPQRSADQPNLLPGNEIPIDRTVNLEMLSRGAQDVMTNTVELSKNINQMVLTLTSGQGTLARLLNDPELGKQTVAHINSIGRSLDTIATSIASGRGFGGKLLVDPVYGDQAARDLGDSLSKMNQILTGIQEGRGGAGALLSEKGEGARIVANLAKASEAMAKVAGSLQKPGTLGNKLFIDEAYGEHLASNLISISDSLASILKKIDGGQGTLGALVNDRSVYDSLSVVAEGIRKSPLVNWYIQKKAEKVAKAAKDEETNPKE
jgi:phospholipid/cholesterol/gamma-HCH transport system substrate-binding protein